MNNTSWIEISKSALENNLNFLKEEVGKNVRISSVVKGNAYGHGINVFVPLAEECGIDHFSVFSADEAFEVFSCCSDNGIAILIMGEADDDALDWAVANGIEFFVFEKDRLLKAVELAKKIGKKAKIHIEADTGMNRTGFTTTELAEVKTILDDNREYLDFKALCTHYAGAESIANYLRIQQQHKAFSRASKFFNNNGFTTFKKHTACSAALMMYPQTRLDMVRVGIMQYGLWPSPETFIRFLGDEPEKKDPLKRIMSWKSRVIATKNIKAGEFVGYGTSYLARNNMKVAVVPVGYAHGYSRTLSNRGRILIRGHRVGVIGIVNMNMLMADITEIPYVEKGDEVVLIGQQGDLSLSVASFSEYSNQLNYEMLTRLALNITRKIID